MCVCVCFWGGRPEVRKEATSCFGRLRESSFEVVQLGPSDDRAPYRLPQPQASLFSRGFQGKLPLCAIRITDAWAVERWTHLIKIEPTKAATLEEGALILSQWGYPTADVSGMRLALEKLAQRAQELGARHSSTGLPSEDEAKAIIAALNTALFAEYGLQGNAENYYDPENSMLHAVLARKKGIPISLSVVWAAVARRCGLECHPLADMPRHVLIRVPLRASDSAESAGPAVMRDLYIDAFDGGKMLVWRELVRFLGAMLGA
ncbi:Fbxo21, partial [Symbiodinium necroappetens]